MNPKPYQPQLTPDFLIRSIHLKVQVLSRAHVPFTFVTTDSRKVQAGCLFVAIKGDHFDGNDFIESAISKGARGVLFKKGVAVPSYKDICLFPVDDPLSAYRKLSGAWRKEFSIPLIVVAGSAGKTTTKELLAAILQGKWKTILKTQESQNGYLGIPMTLLDLRPEHEVAIVEVGIDQIGSMQEHMTLVGANASLLTSIGPEHLEWLQDIPTVAREEGIALSHVAHVGGIVAINLDDPWIRPHVSTLRDGRKIPFSIEGAASSLDMVSGKVTEDGMSLSFEGLGLKSMTVRLPLLGKHNASNLLAAIAVAAGLGLTSEEIQLGLKNFKGVEGRSEIREVPGPTSVICDYYNAQPVSVNAGLDLLSDIHRRSGKAKARWACLGDMLELGKDELRHHRELADKIMDHRIENVLLLGQRMAALYEELKNREFKGNLKHFENHGDLAASLAEKAVPGDAILIKGSRSMKMKEVWNLFENFAKSHWSTR